MVVHQLDEGFTAVSVGVVLVGMLPRFPLTAALATVAHMDMFVELQTDVVALVQIVVDEIVRHVRNVSRYSVDYVVLG